MDKYERVLVESPPNEFYSLYTHSLKNCALPTRRFMILEDKARNEGNEKKAREMKERAYHQMDRIERILDFYRDRIDSETSKTVLYAREFDMYEDIVRYLLDDVRPEMEERGIIFNESKSIEPGEHILYQDRDIIRLISSTMLDNILDCGEGTEMLVRMEQPIMKISGDSPDEEYAKIVFDNSIPNPPEKREGAWNQGLKFAQLSIYLLGGDISARGSILEKYEDNDGMLRGRVEYSIPVDLKKHYSKPL
jgi:hypothetical protein